MEKKVKVPYPTQTSPMKDGVRVSVTEALERSTEVTLADGTKIRLKASVLAAFRIEGEYDLEGNPAYSVQIQNTISIEDSPDHLKRKPADAKIQ